MEDPAEHPEPAASRPRKPGRPGFGDALFSEKLWPAWWLWVVALGISGAGILIAAPISLLAGYLTALVLFVLLAAFLISTSARIEVTHDELRIGRASIERRYIGPVSAFRGEAATEQRGIKLNGLAFLCLRGWVDPVVRVDIRDPDDPTPYWLASTRHPEALVAALTTSPGR